MMADKFNNTQRKKHLVTYQKGDLREEKAK